MNKFSLAIVPFFAISSLGASSLKDAIINGKVSGAFQSYYFSRYKDSKKDNDILTLGLDISYMSASYKGFGVKTTVQTATSPWVDEHSKVARKNNMWGSGAQLSEAYLSYSFLKTIANIGRIYFSSPVMGASASRINKESFEGISIINSDIPDTIVTLGFMNKFQARTDENGKIGKFRKTFKSAASPWVFRLDNGAYTLALKNKSIENLTLVAAYLDAVDAFKTAYFQVDYKISNYTISSQYYSSKEEGKDRGYLLGFQGKVSFGAISFNSCIYINRKRC
ncbi:hypothetical protein CRV08_09860 [Halarcobacter ebronensis]|uniref:Porin domain-containing protein n=1 Tax=Halarcobacter ebronensis TaxID=1462615 RepID=A0A4Q0YBF4_9BACT|nr:OprD family outer membrane porin [Halarcobacter ebronensis]RXJ67666.1 hypothetical protein CRV08_09860 [Halarcobacter ebronensis]